jgi:uncharacterized protein (TIRG00374 family)
MRRAKVWVGIGISLICLALALRGIEWGQVWQHLGRAHYTYLVAAALFVTLGLVARAFRWQLLFFPHRGLSPVRLFAVSNIGYLLINILPARVGDLARAYLISRGEQISTAHALSTIIMERIYDTCLVVLILAAVSSFIPLPRWAARGGLTAGVLTAALAGLFFALGKQTERLLSLWHWLTKRVQAAGIHWLARVELDKQIRSALEGLAVLQYGKVALGILGWSAVVWICNLIPFYLVMRALDLDLPWSAAGFTVSVTALSMIIPSSPGYVGVFESGVILSLALFAVEREAALAYALVIHAVVYTTANLLGLIGLWQESLSFSILRRQLDREAWAVERRT